MLRPLRSLIARLEAQPVSPAQGVLAFLAIVMMRYGLEALLEAQHTLALHLDLRLALVDILHVTVSWALLFVLLAFGLAWSAGRTVAQASRVVLSCLPLIWLPPVFDYTFGFSGTIAYQHDFGEFVSSFVGLFNPAVSVSYVTPGVRLEVALAVLSAACYAGLAASASNWAWARAAMAAGWTYACIFLLGFLPALWFALIGGSDADWLARSVLQARTTHAPLTWYLPLAVLLFPLWLRAAHAGLWQAWVSALRPSRLLIYLAIANLGFYQATRTGLVGWDWLNLYDLGEGALANLAVWLAFVSMTLVNDLHDRAIDAVSNPDRPLVRGTSTPDDMVLLAMTCAGLALWLAVAVDEVAAYPLGMALALGWLYSAPPMRLRRFVGLAHAALAGIAGSVYLFGAALVLGNLAFQQIDQGQLGALISLFFFGAHFKDIKDEAGDRAAGVTTLATWLGGQRAYWVIGAVLLVSLLGLMLSGSSPMRWTSWAGLVAFAVGWLAVRDAERMFGLMLLAFGLVLLGWPLAA